MRSRVIVIVGGYCLCRRKCVVSSIIALDNRFGITDYD